MRRKYDVAMEQCDKQFQFLKMRQRSGTCKKDAQWTNQTRYQRPDERGTGCQLPKEKNSLNLQNGCLSKVTIYKKSSEYGKSLWTQRERTREASKA